MSLNKISPPTTIVLGGFMLAISIAHMYWMFRLDGLSAYLNSRSQRNHIYRSAGFIRLIGVAITLLGLVTIVMTTIRPAKSVDQLGGIVLMLLGIYQTVHAKKHTNRFDQTETIVYQALNQRKWVVLGAEVMFGIIGIALIFYGFTELRRTRP